jgi:heme exporter protein B
MTPPWFTALKKEFTAELRAKQGITTSGLFGLMAVAACGFASSIEKPGPGLAAGLLSVILLFVSTVAIPRIFIAEQEQGTFDLYRQWASPTSIFLGKLLFAAVQMILISLMVGAIYVAMVAPELEIPWLYWVGTILFGIAASNVLCIAGSLVMGAANRWILAGVISLPLTFPLVFMGVGLLRVAFGEGTLNGGFINLIGLLGYAVAPIGLGPFLAESLWNEANTEDRKGPQGQGAAESQWEGR